MSALADLRIGPTYTFLTLVADVWKRPWKFRPGFKVPAGLACKSGAPIAMDHSGANPPKDVTAGKRDFIVLHSF